MDPHFAIHIGTQESSFNITSLQLTTVLGSGSKYSTNGHRFGYRGENFVEIEAFLHKLSSNNHAGFELSRSQIFNVKRTTMLDLESSWNRFRTGRVTAFFAKGAIFDVALLFPVHSGQPLGGRRGLKRLLRAFGREGLKLRFC